MIGLRWLSDTGRLALRSRRLRRTIQRGTAEPTGLRGRTAFRVARRTKRFAGLVRLFIHTKSFVATAYSLGVPRQDVKANVTHHR